MIPPAWVLPATVMIKDAQRDDSPLAIMRSNLSHMWELFSDADPERADRLLNDIDFMAGIRADFMAHGEAWGQSVFPMMEVALRLRAMELTPAAVAWAPGRVDGVDGYYMEIRPEE